MIKDAKSSGGDKYECTSIPGFIIYVPQTISRQNGAIKQSLMINISEKN